MMTDPIADLLTRIRNASQGHHAGLRVPASKVKAEIARILKSEGFIENFELVQEGPQGTLNILLKYGADKLSVIRGIRRLSTPGCRRYVKTTSIPKVLGGLGIAIVSTSQGMMSDRDARKAKVGGELICAVW